MTHAPSHQWTAMPLVRDRPLPCGTGELNVFYFVYWLNIIWNRGVAVIDNI